LSVGFVGDEIRWNVSCEEATLVCVFIIIPSVTAGNLTLFKARCVVEFKDWYIETDIIKTV